jgi:hypothetical protein
MRSAGPCVLIGLMTLAWVAPCSTLSADQPSTTDALRALFAAGRKSTPTAVAEALAKYEAFRAAGQGDSRIEYAYAIVLINQRKYRQASDVLSRYLNANEPRLSAHCLLITALIPLGESGTVLELTAPLAQAIERNPGSEPASDREEAARFLGLVYRYLELPRKGAVDPRVLDEHKREVLALLDAPCTSAFDQGYNALARQYAKLQAEHNERNQQLATEISERKEIDRQKLELAKAAGEAADAKSEFSQDQLRELQAQYTELQKQMSPFVQQRSTIQAAIVARRAQIEQDRQNRNLSQTFEQALRREINVLEDQVDDLNRRLRPLSEKAAALESKANRHQYSLLEAENSARKSQRIGLQAARQIERAKDKLRGRSTAVDSKLTLFSSYAPFSYDVECQRVLDWFEK